MLKVQLPDNKDWRIHLQQMDLHQKNISSLKEVTNAQLKRMHKDISSTLEQISSREKYINSQFETSVMITIY